MAKSRAEKEASLAQIKDRLSGARSVVLADYRGLDVAQATELRRRLRGAGVEYHVVKNTLMRRAVAEAGIAGLEPVLTGPTAIAFSPEDPTVGPRELHAFGREFPQLEIKGGLLGTEVLAAERVRALAELPPRPQLLARTAGAFAAPLAAVAGLFSAPLRGLCIGLDALRRQRAEAPGATEA